MFCGCCSFVVLFCCFFLVVALVLTVYLGWVEKWKNDILKCADVDYYGTIYIKQGLIEKNRIFKILAGCFYVLKF